MVNVKGLGECEIIGTDEFTITVVVEGENTPRFLDREDYPELSANCGYEKTLSDILKTEYMDAKKGDFVYVSIFNAFDTRQITPYETRTKLEDYIRTFDKLNGDTFIDDLVADGTATLVSKREKGSIQEFSGIVQAIEELYKGDEDE